jgi:choline-glycine betaine transporter
MLQFNFVHKLWKTFFDNFLKIIRHIYAVTDLVMAYFSFRKGYPNLVSVPIKAVFGQRT